jgi:hypothetical protein
MKRLFFWIRKNFGVLTLKECNKLNLKFCYNLYGENAQRFACRSMWMDKYGEIYRCSELYNENQPI